MFVLYQHIQTSSGPIYLVGLLSQGLHKIQGD